MPKSRHGEDPDQRPRLPAARRGDARRGRLRLHRGRRRRRADIAREHRRVRTLDPPSALPRRRGDRVGRDDGARHRRLDAAAGGADGLPAPGASRRRARRRARGRGRRHRLLPLDALVGAPGRGGGRRPGGDVLVPALPVQGPPVREGAARRGGGRRLRRHRAHRRPPAGGSPGARHPLRVHDPARPAAAVHLDRVRPPGRPGHRPRRRHGPGADVARPRVAAQRHAPAARREGDPHGGGCRAGVRPRRGRRRGLQPRRPAARRRRRVAGRAARRWSTLWPAVRRCFSTAACAAARTC